MKKHEYTPLSQPPKQVDMREEIKKRQRSLERAVAKFMVTLQSSKLDRNKTMKEKQGENSILSELMDAAQEVEKVIAGGGSMGIVVTALRMCIFMRDKLNESRYEVNALKRQIDELEKATTHDESRG
jgi:hypothetical protein